MMATLRPLPVLFVLLLAMGCSQDAPEPSAPAENAPSSASSPQTIEVAVLHTTQGKIVVRFFPDKAPEHVCNFLTHARAGFYEGTYFHRVLPGFMIQGGDSNTRDDDPNNDGMGGYSYKGTGTYLKAEFSKLHHDRGILSMARMKSPDSAGSQFFIMVAANRGLDGQYTIFGKVVQGMDVVDRIVSQPGQRLAAGGVNPYERQYITRVEVLTWTPEELQKASAR